MFSSHLTSLHLLLLNEFTTPRRSYPGECFFFLSPFACFPLFGFFCSFPSLPSHSPSPTDRLPLLCSFLHISQRIRSSPVSSSGPRLAVLVLYALPSISCLLPCLMIASELGEAGALGIVLAFFLANAAGCPLLSLAFLSPLQASSFVLFIFSSIISPCFVLPSHLLFNEWVIAVAVAILVFSCVCHARSSLPSPPSLPTFSFGFIMYPVCLRHAIPAYYRSCSRGWKQVRR